MGRRRKHGIAVTCRRCECRSANRPRGLCWICYDVPGVRTLYPPVNWQGGTIDGMDPCVVAPLPAAATDAPPGTAAKVRVMSARAAARQVLHHPDDRGDLEGVAPEQVLSSAYA